MQLSAVSSSTVAYSTTCSRIFRTEPRGYCLALAIWISIWARSIDSRAPRGRGTSGFSGTPSGMMVSFGMAVLFEVDFAVARNGFGVLLDQPPAFFVGIPHQLVFGQFLPVGFAAVLDFFPGHLGGRRFDALASAMAC